MQLLKAVTLDINTRPKTIIQAKQNDIGRYIQFTLTNNGIAIDLTNFTVRVYAKKTDNTVSFNNATVNNAINGIVNAELTNQMLSVVGIINCELVLYSSDGSKTSSMPFIIYVNESVNNENAVQSSNEYNALVSALNSVNNAVQSVPTVEQLNTNLQNNISTGNTLKSNLDSDISTGNTLHTTLQNDISTGNTTKTNLENVIATADTTTYATKGDINSVNSSLADKQTQLDFYNINNMKNKRMIPLTFNSDTGHFSTFDGSKACNGIMTAMSDGTSGYVIAMADRTTKLVKFNMPIGVIIGDSIAEGHPNQHGRLSISAGGYDLNLLNSPGQISYHIEQNVKYRIYNHGIGGQRLDQIRTRWNRDVLGQTDTGLTPTSTLSNKPNFVIINGGINDVFYPRTYADMIADMEFMIDSAISNNIYPIVMNVGSHYQMDSTKLALVKQFNAWLSDKVQKTPNMTLIDYYSYINDTNNDGKPLAGLTADGVHPTQSVYEDLARKIINEAFVDNKPPVFTKYINISTAMSVDKRISGGNRPTVMLLYINDVPRKFVELPNTPNQVIEIPFVNEIMDTISLEPEMAEVPYECPTNTTDYVYISEVYLSDKNIYPNGLINRNESLIKALPSVSGIGRFYGAIPDNTTAGQFTFVNTVGAGNCAGVYTLLSTTTGYICTKGLCIIKTVGTVYDGDLIITSTSGKFDRSATPTAGTVFAKVIKASAVFSLINIL